MSVLTDVLLLITGFTAVYFGGRYFIDNASKLAAALKVRPFIIGSTIVAFGTSAPEFFLALLAGIQGISTVSLGNVVGANVANVTVILALCALITPITMRFDMIKRESVFAIIAVVFLFMLSLDGEISLVDGSMMVLVFGIIAVSMIILMKTKKPNDAVAMEYKEICAPCPRISTSFLSLVIGLLILLIGAQVALDSGLRIAIELGLSEFFIGLTVMTLGTILPEIAVSILAAFRKGTDIALGNSLGSVVFNTLVVAGMGGMLQGLEITATLIIAGITPLILFTTLLVIILMRRNSISRQYGILLFGLYIGFIIANYLIE